MADVSVLGQGAPIVPYLDGILLHRHFQTTGRVGVVLNIGGISNISAILLGIMSMAVKGEYALCLGRTRL